MHSQANTYSGSHITHTHAFSSHTQPDKAEIYNEKWKKKKKTTFIKQARLRKLRHWGEMIYYYEFLTRLHRVLCVCTLWVSAVLWDDKVAL